MVSVKRFTLVIIGLFLFAFAATAFANERSGREFGFRAHLKQELEQIKKNTQTIRVEGSLICKMGEANTGQACDLRIEEIKSGKIYRLTQEEAARRLLSDGTKQVAITGVLRGDQTIEVSQVQAL